ncbi:hypothetical protein [Pseudoclavibacter sp. CFCC 11306]|uniref:hypothetical protein n=2 Tax=unclassified Pseudoclavibacter TaxID=2615177 RepID=UPI001301619F|nr:hypothetical protein [Pseudoclavibacter sp. CFCC 11306]KAB1658326.1 hypothetical protein F8O09_01490 [Pseudoclavibacter sp. CFCC 11306]
MRSQKAMRSTIGAGVGVLALVGALLAGCSSQPDRAVASGDASDAVVASDFDLSRSSIDPKPDLQVDGTQLSIGSAGDGRFVDVDQDAVLLGVSMFNLKTGKALGQAADLPAVSVSFLRGLNSPVYGAIADALKGQRVGDVFTLVVPNVDGADPSSTDGSGAGDVVVIGTVRDSFPARAHGAEQAPVNGFPQVVRDTTGRPGLVLGDEYSSAGAPESAVLVKGDSKETAQAGDTVQLQMTMFDTSAKTRSAKVLQSTWDDGQLTQLKLDDSDDAFLGLMERTLTSVPIGSQVIVHVPTSYQSQVGDLLVIDVLARTPAAE